MGDYGGKLVCCMLGWTILLVGLLVGVVGSAILSGIMISGAIAGGNLATGLGVGIGVPAIVAFLIFLLILTVCCCGWVGRSKASNLFRDSGIKENWSEDNFKKLVKDIEGGEYQIEQMLNVKCYHSGYTQYGSRYDVTSYTGSTKVKNVSCKKIKCKYPNFTSELVAVTPIPNFVISKKAEKLVQKQMKEYEKKNKKRDKYVKVTQSWKILGLPKNWSFSRQGSLPSSLKKLENKTTVCCARGFCFPLTSLVQKYFKKTNLKIDVHLESSDLVTVKLNESGRTPLSQVVAQMPYSMNQELQTQVHTTGPGIQGYTHPNQVQTQVHTTGPPGIQGYAPPNQIQQQIPMQNQVPVQQQQAPAGGYSVKCDQCQTMQPLGPPNCINPNCLGRFCQGCYHASPNGSMFCAFCKKSFQ